jgi:hypothetical protein
MVVSLQGKDPSTYFKNRRTRTEGPKLKELRNEGGSCGVTPAYGYYTFPLQSISSASPDMSRRTVLPKTKNLLSKNYQGCRNNYLGRFLEIPRSSSIAQHIW